MDQNKKRILERMEALKEAFEKLEDELMDLSRPVNPEALFNEMCQETDAYPFQESLDQVTSNVRCWVQDTKEALKDEE